VDLEETLEMLHGWLGRSRSAKCRDSVTAVRTIGTAAQLGFMTIGIITAMNERTECPYCGWEIEVLAIESADAGAAQIVYGEEPGARVREARELRLDPSTTALHHVCSDRRMTDSDWWKPGSWWACKEPERKLDDDVRYDLNCVACAQRWVANRAN
jgi:hypothetical protein